MDTSNINKLMRLCTTVADRADEAMDDDTLEACMFPVFNSGMRNVGGIMRRGVADIQLLLNEYSEMAFRLKISDNSRKEMRSFLQAAFGDYDLEIFNETEVAKIIELCRPAREYIESVIKEIDDGDNE